MYAPSVFCHRCPATLSQKSFHHHCILQRGRGVVGTRVEEEGRSRGGRGGEEGQEGREEQERGSYIKSYVQFLSRLSKNGFSRFPELPANLTINQLISTIGYRKKHYFYSFSDETKKLSRRSSSIYNLNTTRCLTTCISTHYHEFIAREDCHQTLSSRSRHMTDDLPGAGGCVVHAHVNGSCLIII